MQISYSVLNKINLSTATSISTVIKVFIICLQPVIKGYLSFHCINIFLHHSCLIARRRLRNRFHLLFLRSQLTFRTFYISANQIPSTSSSDTCPSSDYRFATPPIPMRTNRVYGAFSHHGLNPTHQQPMPFSYSMSPYQSPMDSPLTSPFTSPSPSPKSSPLPSPLPSPRLSPFPSPVESPMFRKKFGGDRNCGRRNSEQYTSVYDWLKSLRLHKYSETFKDYTFEEVSRNCRKLQEIPQ